MKFKNYINEAIKVIDVYRLFNDIKKTVDDINSNMSRGNYDDALKNIKVLKTKTINDLEKEIKRRNKERKKIKIYIKGE